MTLSKGQRRILLVGILLFAVVGAFPPWIRKDAGFGYKMMSYSGSAKSLGHRFIGNPPTDDVPAHSFTIDYPRLLVDWAVVIVLTAGILVLSGGKKKTAVVAALALLTIVTGCHSREQREEMRRTRELSEARSDLFLRLLEHKPSDKKIPLLAAKYGIPEQAARDFVSAYSAEQMQDSLTDILAVTNLVQVQELRSQLDSVPPVSNTVASVSAKYEVDSKVLASLLVDYYTWLSAERKGLDQ